MDFERVPALRLMGRAFELRANVSAYDACYIDQAKALSCQLVTVDARLATAHPVRCARSASYGERIASGSAPSTSR